MTVTLESTTRIVTLNGIECRLWEGTTEAGVRVYALIPRIAAHKDSDLRQFEAELLPQKAPTDIAMQVFPLRMLI
ncbi:MAG TPA: hypothetical protein VG273_16395 [Bryobacteraceae bacterium]|jgi:hypothetical protein|nr:hypothetical protein [Bryobacteraceae bacterium]